jgi:hypothetical protein
MSYVDWWLHLLASPDKQPELLRESIIAQGDMYGTSDPRFTDAT